MTSTKAPRQKLTEEAVKDIYLSSEMPSVLAKRYNIETRRIHRIRSGEIWADFTDKLGPRG